MKTMISTGFHLTALFSLGIWWLWFLGGATYYYMVEGASVWASMTSGAGIALAISVAGAFSSFASELFEPSS